MDIKEYQKSKVRPFDGKFSGACCYWLVSIDHKIFMKQI